MSDIGAWIREQRTRKGLTLTGLAKKVGADAARLAEWEQGIQQPSAADMASMEAFFGPAGGTDHPSWWGEAMRLKDEMPLRDLAQKLGITSGVLSAELRKAGVRRRLRLDTAPEPKDAPMTTPQAPTSGRRSGSKDSQIEQFYHLLGNIPDSEVARLATVSVRTVASYRARRDIAGYNGPRRRPQARGGRQSKLDDYEHMLGKLPDRVVADEAGMSLGAVRNYRIKNDISAAGRMPKSEIGRLLNELRRNSPAVDEALPPEPGEVSTPPAPPVARVAAPEPVAQVVAAPKPTITTTSTSARAWRFTLAEESESYIVVAKSLLDAVARASAQADGDETRISTIESLGPVLTANL